VSGCTVHTAWLQVGRRRKNGQAPEGFVVVASGKLKVGPTRVFTILSWSCADVMVAGQSFGGVGQGVIKEFCSKKLNESIARRNYRRVT
jgi:hypothetical protein